MSKSNSRRDAVYILMRWQALRENPTQLLNQVPNVHFVQNLVYTVFRRMRILRKVLGNYLQKWPKGELEYLLYVGAAQILYLDETPDFAAVSETVEAAKMCSNPSISRVVNGVLRRLLREKDEVLKAIAAEPLEVRESFPTALVKDWIARFGRENAEKLAHYHNSPAETYLAYPDRFEKLPRGVAVRDVPGYAEGAFIVQDPATHHAIELVAVQKDERVLDLCAAPGGKTIQLVWQGAAVMACEINPKRRRLLEQNLKRVGMTGKVAVIDETPSKGAYSAVLVDAPCSNTGVLRRRPDARWNWSIEKLQELVGIQAELLERATHLVQPGGRLVYSTCSNDQRENQDQVAAFLQKHPDWTLEKEVESLPFETGFDGAFVARLRAPNRG